MSNCNCCGEATGQCRCSFRGGCYEGCIVPRIKIKRNGWVQTNSLNIPTPPPLHGNLSIYTNIYPRQFFIYLDGRPQSNAIFSHGHTENSSPLTLNQFSCPWGPGVHGISRLSTQNSGNPILFPNRLSNFKYIVSFNISVRPYVYQVDKIILFGVERLIYTAVYSSTLPQFPTYTPIQSYIIARCNDANNSPRFFIKQFVTLENQWSIYVTDGDFDLTSGWAELDSFIHFDGQHTFALPPSTHIDLDINLRDLPNDDNDISGYQSISFGFAFTGVSEQLPLPQNVGDTTFTNGYVASVTGNIFVYGKGDVLELRNEFGNLLSPEINECSCFIVQTANSLPDNPNFTLTRTGGAHNGTAPYHLIYAVSDGCPTGLHNYTIRFPYHWNLSDLADFSECKTLVSYSTDTFGSVFGVPYHHKHMNFEHITDACNSHAQTECGFLSKNLLFGITGITLAGLPLLTYDNGIWVFTDDCINCTMEFGQFNIFDIKFTYTLNAACFSTNETFEVYGKCNSTRIELATEQFLRIKYNFDGTLHSRQILVNTYDTCWT